MHRTDSPGGQKMWLQMKKTLHTMNRIFVVGII